MLAPLPLVAVVVAAIAAVVIAFVVVLALLLLLLLPLLLLVSCGFCNGFRLCVLVACPATGPLNKNAVQNLVQFSSGIMVELFIRFVIHLLSRI